MTEVPGAQENLGAQSGPRKQNDPAMQSGPRAKYDRVVSVLLGVAGVACVLGMDVAMCPLAGIFGIPCPSCGLTRATLAVIVGDLRRAHALHPGIWPVLVYLVVGAVAMKKWRGRTPVMRTVGVVGFVILGGLVVLWIARFGGAFGGPVAVHPWRW